MDIKLFKHGEKMRTNILRINLCLEFLAPFAYLIAFFVFGPLFITDLEFAFNVFPVIESEFDYLKSAGEGVLAYNFAIFQVEIFIICIVALIFRIGSVFFMIALRIFDWESNNFTKNNFICSIFAFLFVSSTVWGLHISRVPYGGGKSAVYHISGVEDYIYLFVLFIFFNLSFVLSFLSSLNIVTKFNSDKEDG